MARRKVTKSPAVIAAEKRDLSPLKLTPKDAAFLNSILKLINAADERASKGGNGNAYAPISAWKRLQMLAGKSAEQMRVWDLQRNEFKMRYPVGTCIVRVELKFIRKRVKKYQEQQAALAAQKNEVSK